MTSKQTLRLTFVTVAVVVFLAIVCAAFMTLTPATARADGAPISGVLSEFKYGLSAAQILESIEDGSGIYWYSDPSSTIDGSYSGTITATLYDLTRENVLADDDDYVYVSVGDYSVLVEWTANGDFEAGSEWFDIEITRCELDIKLEDTFFDNSHYGDTFSYVGDTNYLDASTYITGGLYIPVTGDDVNVKLAFVDGENNPIRPNHAGNYTIKAFLEGNDMANYVMCCEEWDDGLGDYTKYYSNFEYEYKPFTLLPKNIPVSFNVVYSELNVVEDIASYTTGIAYLGTDLNVVAVTSYTEEIDGDNVAVVKPIITGWSAMMQGSVVAPNLPDEYRITSANIEFEALVDGIMPTDYTFEAMTEFVLTVEKREVLFQQWIDTAPYIGGDAIAPVYNFQPVRTPFEETNGVYLSYFPIDDLVWNDLKMQCAYTGDSFEVGDELDVNFYLDSSDLDLYYLSMSSDPTSVHYTIVKGDPIIGDIEDHEQVATWYCYEPLGAMDYTAFVKSKVDFDIRSYNDLENIQLDPTTWYWWDADHETYTEGRLPIDVIAGEYSLRVYTKATANYNAKMVRFNVTITKAPIIAVWKEESTMFEQSDMSVGPQSNQFEYYVFEEKAGNETYNVAPDVFDPYGSGSNFYSPVWLDGQTASLYAGNFTAYLTISSANGISDAFAISNPEFNWSVDYKHLTFDESTLHIPATFIYGGDDGETYYAKPYIDYRKSSKTYDFMADEWVDPAEICIVTGEITGFGKAAEQYKYPYEEKWEYNTVSALYDGEWTLWTNETYPKDKGNYYVRYSATFCYANWTYDEQGNQVPDPDTFDPSKGMFKVDYVYGAFTIQPKEIFIEWSNLEHDYDAQVHDAVVNAELCYGESVAGLISYETGIKDAGTYALTASIGANYSIGAGETATLTISKVNLTVTADPKLVVYGDAVPQYTASIMGWQGDDEAALSDTLMAAIDWSDSTYAQYNDIGEYSIVAKGLTAANYTFSYENATLTVEPAVIHVEWAEPNYTYDGSERNIQIATAKGVQNEDIALIVECEETVKDAKTYTLVADKQYINNNYTLADTEYALTIAAKALTITPNDSQSKVFGDADAVLTYAVTGGVNFSGEEPVFSGELSRIAGEIVGNYTITLGSLAVNSNYVIDTFVDNKVFTITKRTITVVPTGNQGKTFGESDPVLTYDYTNKHPFEDENNKPVFTGALSRVAGEENGKYLITIGTLALSNAEINDNYQLAFDATVQFEIGKAAVDMSGVVFANASFTYDGQTHSIVVSNLPATITAVSYAYNGESATGAVNAGTYTITATFTPDGDHRAPADMTATLTIGQRELVVTPNAAQSKIYGEAEPVFTYAVSNNVVGETPVFVGALARAEGKNVGDYAINAGTLALSNAANVNKNYVWSFAAEAVNFAITARPISYTLATQTFTYGDDIALVEPEVGGMGLAEGDSRADVYMISFNLHSNTNVGTYYIGVSSKANKNYDATLTGADYKILKAQLTAVNAAQTGTLTYNKAAQTAEVVTAATAVNDMAVTFTYSKTAGSYGDMPTFTAAGTYTVYYKASAANHNDVTGQFTVTIGKATYDMSGVKFEGYNGVYDGEDHSIEAIDLPEGVSVAYVNNSIRNVGSVQVTANFTGDADNYFAIDSKYAEMTVTARTVTLVPAALSKTYGDEDPALTYTWNNIVETPVIYGELYRVPGETAGTYAVKVDKIGFTNAAVNNNYLLATDDSVVFTVNKRVATISANDVGSVYGDAIEAITFTRTNVIESDGNSKLFSYSCAVEQYDAVGSYAISLVATQYAKDNYDLTLVGNDYVITKRAITITVDAKSSVYGEAQVALTAVATLDADAEGIAIIEGDDVYALTCDVTATSVVGSYDITVVPANNANYALTIEGEEDAYTVTKRAITITVDAKSSIFGDAIVALTAVETLDADAEGIAIVNEDEVYTLTCDVTATSAVGAYAITVVPANNANYTLTIAGEEDAYTLAQRELTLAWGETSFIYNKAAQLPTATIGNTVEGQAVTLTVSGEQVNAGTYTATTAINNANYKLPAVSTKSFTIAKADSAIDLSGIVTEKAYTGSELTFAGATAYNDEADITYVGNKQTKVGTYTITVSVAETKNFNAESKTLEVKVLEAEPIKGADGKEEFYKDIEPEAAASTGVDINAIIANAAKAGDNAGLTLKVGEGATQSTIVLDAAAINALSGKDVKLTYEVKEGEAAAAAVKGAELVLEISLSGMTEGNATITVPFENKAPGGKVAKIFFVDENGKKTDMKGVFENGTVTFTTDHNSTYMVAYVLSTGTIIGIIVGAVVAVAVVVVLVIVLGKKKKGGAPAKKEEEAPAKDAE